MALPQFQAGIDSIVRVFNQMQTAWASALNPIINRPQNNSNILPKVELVTGDNVIPHTLDRTLVGWSVIRYRGSWAEIFDKQDENTKPEVNLILNSSADVTVDLEVF